MTSRIDGAPSPAGEPTPAGAAPLRTGGVPLEIRDVAHTYGRGPGAVAALGPVSLEVPAGEFLVLVGPSGCGKSTLLRLIAGFEEATSGTLRVGGEKPEPGRQAGIVFQQARLLPWRTVGGNVDLALRLAGVPREQRPARVEQLLDRVGLAGTGKRRTWEISGGQQQRVAISRALAGSAPVLLLDEPFAALDALTRERLQEDLRQVSAETGKTCVFVTHSVDEAVFLGSRVVVLSQAPGRVALDREVPLPRSGLSPDELRGLPEYAALRAEIGAAVRSVAS